VLNVSLDTLYEDHLRTMMQRTDSALEAAKFDALVVHAGAAPLLFLDDQTYPYKVNPHFKAWVPIIDNPQCVLIYAPGARPRVLFHQPNDYWHKPARLPRESWTHSIELIPTADPRRRRGAGPSSAESHSSGPGSALRRIRAPRKRAQS